MSFPPWFGVVEKSQPGETWREIGREDEPGQLWVSWRCTHCRKLAITQGNVPPTACSCQAVRK